MALDPEMLDAKFADWLARIQGMHEGPRHRTNPRAHLAPLIRPLSASRVGLVSSAGPFVAGDTPFDVDDPAGDPSFRLIPGNVDSRDLHFAHSHYDTSSAVADPNVVLPIDRLRELVADGQVGSASPVHVGMMGFNPDPIEIVEVSAPKVVEIFTAAEVDAVVLAPG